MKFPRKCIRCPPFLGYICWPKIVGALLLLLAPLPYFLSGVPGSRCHRVGKSSGAIESAKVVVPLSREE